MNRFFIAVMLNLFFLHASTAQDNGGHLPFELSLEQVASGFSSPVDIANAGDSRLFVVERGGLIRILTENFDIESVPFLDIDDRVINAGGQSEQGLLALEFHHDYVNTGWFYVHYSDNDGNTVISRFSVDPDDTNKALPDSEKIIFTANQPFNNHNGGSIKFGPDNMLYIGLGDGGASNDPQNLAQNTQSPLGKILRLDIDNGDPYSIPTDNPFGNDPDVLDEIWAIGLRNPWKFSFDSRTGDLWIGDVGQNKWEEIDLQLSNSAGGENYGWRCREGNNDAVTAGCSGSFDPPIAEYNHLGFTHCSVTGGYVYRGADEIFEDAPPVYLYADYCSGQFWATYPVEVGSTSYTTVEMEKFSGRAISSFGEDVNGELYAAVLNNGRIYKINSSCNIDLDLQIGAVSCDGINDGFIALPESLIDLYEVQILNISDPLAQVNASALAQGSYEVTVSRFGCERVFDTEVLLIDRAPLQIESDGTSILMVTTTGESYQWYLDGNLIAGETAQTIDALENGSYTVEVLEATGCILTSEPYEFILDSTPVISSIKQWSIAPNPVADILIMQVRTDVSEKYNLTISDPKGKVIHQENVTVDGTANLQVDISKYENGVYLVMLSDGEVVQTKRVVKQ